MAWLPALLLSGPLPDTLSLACSILPQADISEVKSMKNLPAPVKVVMEAVCIMLGVKPKKINDPANPAKKLDDYWEPSQALLGEGTFMTQLQVGRQGANVW